MLAFIVLERILLKCNTLIMNKSKYESKGKFPKENMRINIMYIPKI